MGEKRQKKQEQLVLPFVEGSEASWSEREGVEAPPERGANPRTRLETSE